MKFWKITGTVMCARNCANRSRNQCGILFCNDHYRGGYQNVFFRSVTAPNPANIRIQWHNFMNVGPIL